MDVILVWFIMSNGTGFIAPQHVDPAAMQCGLAGEVIGVTVDRAINPTLALWPDPRAPGQHCAVDISQRVAALAHGEYRLATTIVDKSRHFGDVTVYERFIPHDPHTSDPWLRSLTSPGLPGKPTNFRLTGDGK